MGSVAPNGAENVVEYGNDEQALEPDLSASTTHPSMDRAEVISALQVDRDSFREELVKTKALLEGNSDATNSGEESGEEAEKSASQLERTFLKEQRLQMLVEMEQFRQSITKEMHVLVQKEVAKQLARQSFGGKRERQRTLEDQLEQVEAERRSLASKATLLKGQLKQLQASSAGGSGGKTIGEGEGVVVKKRGPGRPKKAASTNKTDSGSNAASTGKKRGPGRPKKVVPTSTSDSGSSSATAAKKTPSTPRKAKALKERKAASPKSRSRAAIDLEDPSTFLGDMSSEEEERASRPRARKAPLSKRPSRSAKVAAKMRITDDFGADPMDIFSSEEDSDNGAAFVESSEEEASESSSSSPSPVRKPAPKQKKTTPKKKVVTKKVTKKRVAKVASESDESAEIAPPKKRSKPSDERPKKRTGKDAAIDLDSSSDASLEELVGELEAAHTLEAQVAAALKLASRCSSSSTARTSVSKIPGAIRLLVRLLASNMSPELRSISAETLAWLMSDVPENRTLVGEEKRGLSSLVDLLSASLPQNCRLNGVMALSNAVSDCLPNAKRLVEGRASLAYIVQGLKPSMPEYARAYAALTLENIACSPELRDKVVAQRGCVAGVLSLLSGSTRARDPNVVEQALSTLLALCESSSARAEVRAHTEVLDAITELNSKQALDLLSLIEDSDDEEEEEEE